MTNGDNEDVSSGDGMNVTEGDHLLVAMHDGSGGFSGDDLAENTGHLKG